MMITPYKVLLPLLTIFIKFFRSFPIHFYRKNQLDPEKGKPFERVERKAMGLSLGYLG